MIFFPCKSHCSYIGIPHFLQLLLRPVFLTSSLERVSTNELEHRILPIQTKFHLLIRIIESWRVVDKLLKSHSLVIKCWLVDAAVYTQVVLSFWISSRTYMRTSSNESFQLECTLRTVPSFKVSTPTNSRLKVGFSLFKIFPEIELEDKSMIPR